MLPPLAAEKDTIESFSVRLPGTVIKNRVPVLAERPTLVGAVLGVKDSADAKRTIP